MQKQEVKVKISRMKWLYMVIIAMTATMSLCGNYMMMDDDYDGLNGLDDMILQNSETDMDDMNHD